MQMMENKNKDEISIILILITVFSVTSFFSSFMYIIENDLSDKWFSRFALGVICVGFYGIIRKMK
jgi:hypothetical protein